MEHSVQPEPFESVPHWLLLDKRLTANALRLYLVLRKHRNYATGECFPGRKRLSELTDMSLKSVDRALSNLDDMGAISIERRFDENGGMTSNCYHVFWDQGGSVKNDIGVGTPVTRGVASKTTYELRPIINKDPINENKPGERELKLLEGDKPSRDDVAEVFELWKEETGKHRARLDQKRRRQIKNALKNYPLEDVFAAVKGWKCSPYHCGQNEHGKVYNDIDLLLRDAKHIEQFRDMARDQNKFREPVITLR